MGRVLRRIASWMVGAALACGAAADTASTPWHIEVAGGADKLGEIVFSFAEDGVEVTEIPVAIPEGTPENAVARRIRKELRRALPKDQYDVDIDGGETILLSAKGHTKRFVLRLVRNTVRGTQIDLVRE